MNRKIRMGMVGGGHGAFIGGIHRIAAAIDGEVELVCGAFSSDPAKSKAFGATLYLPENRVYDSFEEMIMKEKQLPEGERMDFVSIVTPNHVHFPPAKMALENGFPVLCDKPLAKTGLLFGLTHNYTGYPMVKEAREIVRSGQLGKIRKVMVEYPQGWLTTKLEGTGSKQADWRTDPKRSGAAGCMGDIGTHAENLAEYITGLQITELCADLTAFVEGRLLDDDGNLLLHFDNGAKGVLSASQICVGDENNLNIRVYGEIGGIEWRQEEPNTLIRKYLGRPKEILRPGVGNLSELAKAHIKVAPPGHPEGFLEAFSNIYRNFARTLRSTLKGETPNPLYADFPTVEDGVRGMAFIETVVEANQSPQKWYKFKT